MNAGAAGEVVLGPSTSQLLDTLARSYAALLRPGDQVVVHAASHEANAGPWARLARATGAQLDYWELQPGGLPLLAAPGGCWRLLRRLLATAEAAGGCCGWPGAALALAA
jgi:selenocysteine lyase/cysteine desulfurase